MNPPQADLHDRAMMTRTIALSKQSGEAGEYPYGVVICRDYDIVAESINRVRCDSDVTRHAELVAISAAQKALRSTSLDDCTIFVSAEPCALCCYAIRESRIGRVVYALHSPHMGGISKWNVLKDEDLSRTIPEVFGPPPDVVAGFMVPEAEGVLLDWNPLVWKIIKRRGLFITESPNVVQPQEQRWISAWPTSQLMALLRRTFFDRFGRR
jgi:tRNA(adenine34) deaminase